MKTVLLCLLVTTTTIAAELRIGSSAVSITPDRPVALAGQLGTRITQSVEAPIIAAAVAIESVEGGKVADQSILISCDLVGMAAATADRILILRQDGLHPLTGGSWN